jgi:hypothetical protein
VRDEGVGAAVEVDHADVHGEPDPPAAAQVVRAVVGRGPPQVVRSGLPSSPESCSIQGIP